ncbi:unnamed protein product [Meganyctiphanes norvegica]|uniref:G-protein coupled receptors family 1 profile domain-containing protein n=1 Tax=Meganyctiphanes norvegica TaxID=48144 RepID=A0AAV2S583_MEGNR
MRTGILGTIQNENSAVIIDIMGRVQAIGLPKGDSSGRQVQAIYLVGDRYRKISTKDQTCNLIGEQVISATQDSPKTVVISAVFPNEIEVLVCMGDNKYLDIGRMARHISRENSNLLSDILKNDSLTEDAISKLETFVCKLYGPCFPNRMDDTRRKAYTNPDIESVCANGSNQWELILTVTKVYIYFCIVLYFERRPVNIAALIMGSTWTLAVILALLPLSGLPYFGDHFYGSNGMCLPLHIHDPYAQAWQYSAVMFIVLNLSAFLFILYAYIRMLVTIQSSRASLRSSQEKQDRVLAKRFAFIVGTDFLCWMPVIIIKSMALSGVSIPTTLYAWLAVFVLPVNSALNPILYTLTTKMFKQQVNIVDTLVILPAFKEQAFKQQFKQQVQHCCSYSRCSNSRCLNSRIFMA